MSKNVCKIRKINIDFSLVGEKVVVRTYSAGNWFGTLEQKSGNEVILSDARRLWRWFASEGISLSEVSQYGIIHEHSRICEAVDSVWIEAIEIITASKVAVKSIESAPHAKRF